ncbi:MAG TPA: hypothetical protein VFF03_18375 [Rhodocyclaceae bacterium]|nr:hypothetical protein [Rhodocyclaceae bacterium]
MTSMTLTFARRAAWALIACAAFILAGCSTVDRGAAPGVSAKAQWVVLPFANNTETPLAGSRAEALAEGLLRTAGIAKVKRYPGGQQDALFEPGDRKQQEAALEWAKAQGARYGLTGSVDEWRYKVGVDGEPAVGLALNIVDIASGEVLWSGVGGKSGWARESVAAVAQQLMRSLLDAGLAAKED